MTRRALCLFYHWMTAHDYVDVLTGVDTYASPLQCHQGRDCVIVDKYTLWALKEWRGGPGTAHTPNRISKFPKGPAASTFWSQKGHSSYWDSGAIYHEFGHALQSTIAGDTPHFAVTESPLHKAMNEGFADAFSCALRQASSEASTPDCTIAGYYESNGVRSGPYTSGAGGNGEVPTGHTSGAGGNGEVPTGHTYGYIVEHRCKLEGAEGTNTEGHVCEGHRVGEIFGSVYWRLLTTAGVDMANLISGMQAWMWVTAGNYDETSVLAEQVVEKTWRDCVLQHVGDGEGVFERAERVFALHGMGGGVDWDVMGVGTVNNDISGRKEDYKKCV